MRRRGAERTRVGGRTGRHRRGVLHVRPPLRRGSAEITWLAVHADRGGGAAWARGSSRNSRADAPEDRRLLIALTVSSSDGPDDIEKGYDATRAFYRSVGFVEARDFAGYWGPEGDTPVLMVRPPAVNDADGLLSRAGRGVDAGDVGARRRPGLVRRSRRSRSASAWSCARTWCSACSPKATDTSWRRSWCVAGARSAAPGPATATFEQLVRRLARGGSRRRVLVRAHRVGARRTRRASDRGGSIERVRRGGGAGGGEAVSAHEPGTAARPGHPGPPAPRRVTCRPRHRSGRCLDGRAGAGGDGRDGRGFPPRRRATDGIGTSSSCSRGSVARRGRRGASTGTALGRLAGETPRRAGAPVAGFPTPVRTAGVETSALEASPSRAMAGRGPGAHGRRSRASADCARGAGAGRRSRSSTRSRPQRRCGSTATCTWASSCGGPGAWRSPTSTGTLSRPPASAWRSTRRCGTWPPSCGRSTSRAHRPTPRGRTGRSDRSLDRSVPERPARGLRKIAGRVEAALAVRPTPLFPHGGRAGVPRVRLCRHATSRRG